MTTRLGDLQTQFNTAFAQWEKGHQSTAKHESQAVRRGRQGNQTTRAAISELQKIAPEYLAALLEEKNRLTDLFATTEPTNTRQVSFLQEGLKACQKKLLELREKSERAGIPLDAPTLQQLRISQLEETLAALTAFEAERTEELDSLHGCLPRMQSDLDFARAELQSAQAALAAKEGLHRTLERKLHEANCRLAIGVKSLTAKLTEAERKIFAQAHQIHAVEHTNTQLQLSQARARDSLAQKSKELSRNRDLIATLKAQLGETEAKIESLGAELATARTANTELTRELGNSATLEWNDRQQKLDIISLSAANQDLAAQNRSLVEANTRLRVQVAELEKRLEAEEDGFAVVDGENSRPSSPPLATAIAATAGGPFSSKPTASTTAVAAASAPTLRQ